jgi:hypothetical protein
MRLKERRNSVFNKPKYVTYARLEDNVSADEKATLRHVTQRLQQMPKITATVEDEILEETKPFAITAKDLVPSKSHIQLQAGSSDKFSLLSQLSLPATFGV